jgi:hypothetical protein
VIEVAMMLLALVMKQSIHPIVDDDQVIVE